MTTSLFLTELLNEDLDLVVQKICSEPPSRQRDLLLIALNRLLGKTAENKATRSKLLSIAQFLLSGNYHFLPEKDAVVFFEQLMRFAVTETSFECKRATVATASLVLNRTREQLMKNAARFAELIEKVEATLSPTEKALMSSLQVKVQCSHPKHFSSKGRQFKVPALNIARAAINVSEDVLGDWYQDPWGWPEVRWLGTDKTNLVKARLSTDTAGWSAPLDAVKQGGGVRPALVINPLDRIAFQALVDDLSLQAAGDLPAWVFGWRLARRGRVKAGVYTSNHLEWDRFSRRVTRLCKVYKYTAHLDIRSFFATIDTSSLLAQLGRSYRTTSVLDRLEAYFQTWHSRQNGTGIPQRFQASSVLAHAVLRPLDTFLETMGGKLVPSRWMDDIWLHSNDEQVLVRALTEIEGILSETRLSLNAQKTEIFLSDQAEKTVHLVDAYDTEDSPLSLRDLTEDPPFQVGKKVQRLLKQKDFTSLKDIPTNRWLEFGHLARRLAKGFRISGEWRRFTDVYVDFARSHRSAENLTVASWGEMFPNTAAHGMQEIHNLFAKNLIDGTLRLLTPLAAQRLVAWHPKFKDNAFESVQSSDLSDPIRVRGIAFAALSLKTLSEIGKKVSAEADELTAQFLKDRQFKAPKLSARFDQE